MRPLVAVVAVVDRAEMAMPLFEIRGCSRKGKATPWTGVKDRSVTAGPGPRRANELRGP